MIFFSRACNGPPRSDAPDYPTGQQALGSAERANPKGVRKPAELI
jgi:hypothetical protein